MLKREILLILLKYKKLLYICAEHLYIISGNNSENMQQETSAKHFFIQCSYLLEMCAI